MKVGDVVRVVDGPLLEGFRGVLGHVVEVNRMSMYPIKANFEGVPVLLHERELEVVSVD